MKHLAVALSIISFVCVIKAGWIGPKNDEFKQTIEDCKTESTASDDDVQEVLKTHQPSSKAGQCMMACIQMKTGLVRWYLVQINKLYIDIIKIDESRFYYGHKKAEVFLAPMKAHNEQKFDKIVQILKECKTAETSETDKCVAAKKFGDCMKIKGDAAGIAMKKN